MNELKQYIEERIKTLEQSKIKIYSANTRISINHTITELQAVLSKIEELEKQEFEKIVQVNSKS